jgi:hypothetical protein
MHTGAILLIRKKRVENTAAEHAPALIAGKSCYLSVAYAEIAGILQIGGRSLIPQAGEARTRPSFVDDFNVSL